MTTRPAESNEDGPTSMPAGESRESVSPLARAAEFYRHQTDPAFILALTAPLAAFLIVLFVAAPTLAPGVLNWDNAEFQTVGPLMGTAHPTGYASYIVLGWLATVLLQPLGDPAYRMNVLQLVLAAVAAGATVAIVQLVTDRRWVALAAAMTLASTTLFWRLSLHSDPHMFNLTLVAILFVLLLTWAHRRRNSELEGAAHSDRWLVAAAFVYGVALTNHSLALMLPPAIALFLLVSDWRVILRWRTVLACLVVLAATAAIFYAELPLRAAMGVSQVYGHPNTWDGFLSIVTAEQFRGDLGDPLANLSDKLAANINELWGSFGPVLLLAPVGLVTSVVRRFNFAVLSGLTAASVGIFAASYSSGDPERYYLVVLFVASTWIGVGVADLIDGGLWLAESGRRDRFDRFLLRLAPNRVTPSEPNAPVSKRALGGTAAIVELLVAIGLLANVGLLLPARLAPQSASNPGGVTEALWTTDSAWMHAVLAPTDKGGVPANAVIVSWWGASTTLWYGQRVLGLRPDVYVVDDVTRIDFNLGTVQDVLDRNLGRRPVFVIQLDGGDGGMVALRKQYDLQPFRIPNGSTLDQVVRAKAA